MDHANDKLLYAQSKLENSLQREIYLMRELLGSLQQESELLQHHQARALLDLMNQRQVLLDKLLAVRILREEHVIDLGRLLGITQLGGQGESPLFLSALLGDVLDGCGLLGLRDQLLALMEKAGDMSILNQKLLDQGVIPQDAWKKISQVQVQRPVKRLTTRSTTALATLPEQNPS